MTDDAVAATTVELMLPPPRPSTKRSTRGSEMKQRTILSFFTPNVCTWMATDEGTKCDTEFVTLNSSAGGCSWMFVTNTGSNVMTSSVESCDATMASRCLTLQVFPVGSGYVSVGQDFAQRDTFMLSMQYSPVKPAVHREFPQMHSWSDEFLWEHNFATAQRHEKVSAFPQETAEF